MDTPTPDLYANPDVTMRSIIQRIATGPELSKDISLEEAKAGMTFILDNKADPVQAAIFLIALRMKRESDDEMKGILDALLEVTGTVNAKVDDVVVLSDPYDGYNRTIPSSPFLPAVLAELGVNMVSEGLETVGPKYGVTHKKVLRAAGVPVDLSPQQAADRLADPAIGWAYLDQSQFAPKLFNLMELRSKIVKRPVLTTLDVLLGPVRGSKKTHLVTGYVHKPYPRIYAMLARHAKFNSCLLVRGVEGGVTPSLRQAGKCVYYQNMGEEIEMELNPKELGIEQSVRAAPLPDDLPKTTRPGDEIAIAVDIDAMAKATADIGLQTLEGKLGPVRDGLIYTGALVLNHLKRFDSLAAAAQAVTDVLDSGKVLERIK
jgi:anthranilate phosphoribosyltransferase